MKRHSYAKIIGVSWNWMTTMLFRPFNRKKWIMLGIIILLAGQMGLNFNFNWKRDEGGFDDLLKKYGKKVPFINRQPQRPEVYSPRLGTHFGLFGLGEKKSPDQPGFRAKVSDFKQKMKDFSHKHGKVAMVIAIAIPYIIFIIFLIVLWIWIKAGFSFVFIESVVKNDASLTVPFHKYRPQADSYFKWSLAYGAVVFLVSGMVLFVPLRQLIQDGVFTKTPIDLALIISATVFYVPILLLFAFLFGLIATFMWDFVLPIMHKRRCGITQAISIFLHILKSNVVEMLLYLLVKIGLAILAIFAAIALTVLGLIFVIVFGGLLVVAGYFLFLICHPVVKTIIILLVGLPALGFLGFLFNLFYLPIPLFFRIFPICVLGSIDESLDLFAPKTADELIREEDDDKYDKSMGIVWLAVLAPWIAVFIGAVLFTSIPKMLDIKLKMPRIMIKSEEGGILTGTDMPVIPKFPKRESKLKGDVVIVYLKNGNTFEAVIATESEDNIAFNVEGGTVVYPRDEILRIEKEAGK